MTYRDYLATPEEIIEDARQGRMFILVDDEDRENEGDLVIPASITTPDDINFMVKYGRGLVCLAMTRERCEHLNLPLMARHNGSRHSTAFTVSIEAREGVTTGISAADRAHTIQVALHPDAKASDIVSPGHVFPLVARDGGVLVRAGHTEAAVDVARLAGLPPAGVICEIMNDDGTMARMPDLVRFAQEHGLKVGTIADLIAYRRVKERLVRREMETAFRSVHGGDWRMILYVSTVSYGEHIALVKGDLSGDDPVLVRVHALNLLDDVLGDAEGEHQGQLHQAMDQIAKAGRGVVVLVRESGPTVLADRLKARMGEPGAAGRLVDYGVGAQILLDLGVKDMVLLSNTPKTIIALDGYGLRVVGQRPLS
ncbi:3,4-dihydroxy-2-butanone-4-phosphate synthase [Pararhodospirillum photometricum]|uniref:3,4-dihydroxy-2-butanone 4-phosphate synthase n=1 Tax=Pararhodospirillum photometricum DSM 122 TaxID=1150469 RepID=H6SRL1_PARPM|nr:3,4-dihydroxy-2-butanone-4-phosphate synthase [Pararhodospirillum photometricum]CCG07540.1 GTP cyclohydrolase II [Pararhodospirillum photometricum DSM 122]